MKKNILVAVTGGIGSGKSTAVSVISGAGYPVIDCDEITKSLYKTAKVKRWIKKHFPFAVSGKLFLRVDKSKIAQKAFSDKHSYCTLTDYLTELVFNKAIKHAKKLKGLVFIEVPLLFEKGYQDRFDKVLVILRDKEQRITSVMARSKLTREQVLERMAFQVIHEELDLSGYSVIVNDKDENALKEKVLDFLKKLKTNKN